MGNILKSKQSKDKQDPNSLKWLIDVIGEDYDAEYDKTTFSAGISSHMIRIKVSHKVNGRSKLYLLKTLAPESLPRSKELGLQREALFYHLFRDRMTQVGISLPETILSYGDLNTGQKVIVMEDLSDRCIQLGYFFGPVPPNNWGKDLISLTSQAVDLESGHPHTIDTLTHEAFMMAARLHGRYWLDSSLLEYRWLRGSDWIQNQGKKNWMEAQNMICCLWGTTKEKIANGFSSVVWDSNLISCMDASISKISWSDHINNLQHSPWTLVHGDYHPANMMWDYNKRHIIPLDFEMVGLGSGPQELGEFIISHTDPKLRQNIEERLVRSYYQELISRGNPSVLNESTYSWENCWRDYVMGGAEKWVWILALLSGIFPDPLVQYFQNQLSAFMEDHKITPYNIGIPRF